MNKIVINPEYQNLFSFKTENEKVEHDAEMISFRILSEVEKFCDDNNIKRKDLAELVGTSKSYITQLFNGSKSINTSIMSKIENALNVTFEIKLKQEQISYSDFDINLMKTQFHRLRYESNIKSSLNIKYENDLNEFESKLVTENKSKQIAA